MITFFYDETSDVPKYVQLYRHIKSEIECGHLHYKEKMPSKRKLAEHLNMSAVTVETAYSQLVAEGYLKSVEKSGYYVDITGFPFTTKGKEEDIQKSFVRDDEHYLYDFRTNVVDTTLFPYSIWSKLTRWVLAENKEEILNFTHPQGLRCLREQIALYLSRFRGIEASADQIIVGAGSEMLYHLVIQLLGRENLYATENPGYGKMKQILMNNDCRHINIDLDESGVSLTQLIKSNANVVHLTPSHQFPTGIVMPIKRRIELLEWAYQAKNRFIIEDDYDSEFAAGIQPIPALQGIDQQDKVIYLNTFSKSIAPTLRIGYLVLPKSLLSLYQEKQSYGACTVPNFEQMILTKFMQEGYFESHLNRMRKAYKKRRDVLINALVDNHIVGKNAIYGEDAGLHFIINMNHRYNEKVLIALAKTESVRIYGLSEYYVGTLPEAKTVLILGYSGLSENQIIEAVKNLKQAWQIE